MNNIDAIIFDFGDVFINLDRNLCKTEFGKLGLFAFSEDLVSLNFRFEKGEITEDEFLNGFNKEIPNASNVEIKFAWNCVLGDFPKARLDFLHRLKHKYRLFLLTNTDRIHISHFREKVGQDFAMSFFACFEKVFYSYELEMRKPDLAVFEKVISENKLNPDKTLFIDDNAENIASAKKTGLRVWHLEAGKEDVIDLFHKSFK